jgi:hypothetical protein
MPEPVESPRERESSGSRREPSRLASAEETEQLVVTVTSGEIVKLERVDKAGKREEISDEETAKLAGEDEVEEIETGLEEAFEAGIAAVLGEDDEDGEEQALEQLMMSGVVRPAVLHRLRRRFLRRLLLRRLLRRRMLKRRLRH